jgi:hypothetical protein
VDLRGSAGCKEKRMKRIWVLFALAVLLVFLVIVPALGQTASKISVTGSEVSNGVVLVSIHQGSKTFELQCNQGMNGCTQLTKGVYTMVELPENHGMYVCRDVQVFPESAESKEPDRDSKLGEYCLTAK